MKTRVSLKYFVSYCRLLIKRVKPIKFLGVLLDENLSWKGHIKYIENKVVKNFGLLYSAKLFLDKNSLFTLYYSYIHAYLNYANLSWGSTNRTNLKKLLSQQKYAVRIINNRTRFDRTNELFKWQKILNIYKLNSFHVPNQKEDCTFNIFRKI